jgi:death-on-curing protein
VSIRYIELADYLAIATEITGLDTSTLIGATKLDLAESALHAPAAGFGKTEFYPDLHRQGRRPHRTTGEEPPPARRQQASSMDSASLVHRDQRLDMAHHAYSR